MEYLGGFYLWLSRITPQWIFLHKFVCALFLFLLGLYLEIGLLSRGNSHWTFWSTVIGVWAAVPLSTPPTIRKGSNLPHPQFSSPTYFSLVRISVANDNEHLFVCLLAVFLPSLEKCLFRFSACFKNWIVFGVLSCKSPSHYRPKSLSDIGLINIFSHSVDWLFAFLMVTFKAWKCSILMKYNVSVVFPSLSVPLGPYLRGHCQTQGHRDPHLWSLPGVL